MQEADVILVGSGQAATPLSTCYRTRTPTRPQLSRRSFAVRGSSSNCVRGPSTYVRSAAKRRENDVEEALAPNRQRTRAVRTPRKIDRARETESAPWRLYRVEGAKAAAKRRSEDGMPSPSERPPNLATTKSRSAKCKRRSATRKSSVATSPSRSSRSPRRSGVSPRRSATCKRRFASRPRRFSPSTRRFATLKRRAAALQRRFATSQRRFPESQRRSATSQRRSAPWKRRSATSQRRSAPWKRRSATSQRRSAPWKRRSATSQRRSAPWKRRSATSQRRSAPWKRRSARRPQGAFTARLAQAGLPRAGRNREANRIHDPVHLAPRVSRFRPSHA